MAEDSVYLSNMEEIKKYVSNVDKDTYTISNLREEVVAVIFAYVSRSPKGFRENLLKVTEEKASQFHEKWVLGYGHASVAEHASVHIGIEKVSRLFSAELELLNEYLSFTEYSQRYQKPQKGDFYIPDELSERTKLLIEYVNLNNDLYDIYAQINDSLFDFLKKRFPTPEGVDEKAHHRGLEKVAFEDARYALTLAVHTNLGMTANARAVEDSLTKLLSSKYSEVRARAAEIKEEARFSVPTLVKYANENRYIIETREALEEIARSISREEKGDRRRIRLIDWTGKNGSNAEEAAVDKMVKAILYRHSNVRYEDLERGLAEMSPEEKLIILKKALEKLGPYDNPLDAFKLVDYVVEFVVSEACWHQLLRHRKVNWLPQEPSVYSGITIPPNVEEAGVDTLLIEAASKSEEFYEKLVGEGLPQVAGYVVTNAHNRRILGSFNLWELYHLIDLRMAEGAQWDIKEVIGILAKEVCKYHPNLVVPALERVRAKNKELGQTCVSLTTT